MNYKDTQGTIDRGLAREEERQKRQALRKTHEKKGHVRCEFPVHFRRYYETPLIAATHGDETFYFIDSNAPPVPREDVVSYPLSPEAEGISHKDRYEWMQWKVLYVAVKLGLTEIIHSADLKNHRVCTPSLCLSMLSDSLRNINGYYAAPQPKGWCERALALVLETIRTPLLPEDTSQLKSVMWRAIDLEKSEMVEKLTPYISQEDIQDVKSGLAEVGFHHTMSTIILAESRDEPLDEHFAELQRRSQYYTPTLEEIKRYRERSLPFLDDRIFLFFDDL